MRIILPDRRIRRWRRVRGPRAQFTTGDLGGCGCGLTCVPCSLGPVNYTLSYTINLFGCDPAAGTDTGSVTLAYQGLQTDPHSGDDGYQWLGPCINTTHQPAHCIQSWQNPSLWCFDGLAISWPAHAIAFTVTARSLANCAGVVAANYCGSPPAAGPPAPGCGGGSWTVSCSPLSLKWAFPAGVTWTITP